MIDEPEIGGGELNPTTRLSSVVARLSLISVALTVTGFVTAPLLARALGADGRGELVAILLPSTLAPWILAFALPTYASREAARGRWKVNELAGSLGLPLLTIGALGMAGSFPVAKTLAQGNESVETYLTVGLLLLPIGLLGGLGVAVLGGLERWRWVIVTRLLPVGISLVGIVALYAVNAMTVGRVALLTMCGGALSAVPALVVICRAGRPVFRRAVAWEGVDFGLRSWLGGLALLANARLDQLMMITLTSSRELGLYAVAVTVASLSSFVSSALGPPLITRVAKGDKGLIARALRVTLGATAVMNLALIAVTPILVPLLFGPDFTEAVDQTLVLLVAGIPLAGIAVLGPALAADGAPGAPSIAEAIALLITVPGLLIFVPELGGLGAALVSAVAYGTSFGAQLVITRRRLGGTMWGYLILRREDILWARAQLPSVAFLRR